MRFTTWATVFGLILGGAALGGCCSSRPQPARARAHVAPVASVPAPVAAPVAAAEIVPPANGSDASGAPDAEAVLVHFVPPPPPQLPADACAAPSADAAADVPVCVGGHCGIPPAASGGFSMELPGAECCEGGVCGIPPAAQVEVRPATATKTNGRCRP
jgi:hypothetical protein